MISMAFNMRHSMLPKAPKKRAGHKKTQTKTQSKLPSHTTHTYDQFLTQQSDRAHQQKKEDKSNITIDRYGEQHFVYQSELSHYMQQHPDEVLARWRGPEYDVYDKSATWYLGASVFLVVIILYALFTNSPIMAIVFVLIGIVGYLYITTPPRVMDFGVIYDGIVVGDRLYRFDDIKSFWIFYEPPHKRVISLHMDGYLTPYIHISLHQVDPVEIRELLMKFIPEKKQEHTLVDTLERIIHI